MALTDILFWPIRTGFEAINIIAGLIVLVFVILMLIDCFNRKFKVEAEKWIWFVLIIITTWVGALIYYVVIRAMNPKGIAKP